MLRSTLLALLLAIPAAAQVSSPALSVDLPALDSLRAPQVEEAVRRTLLDAAWLGSDPGFAGASDVTVRARRVGARFIVRATPVVGGVPVEGADRVIVVDDQGLRHVGGRAPLQAQAAFRIAEHDATAIALAAVKGGLVTDGTVERVSGLARKVWVSTGNGLQPAWRVRVPTWRIQDLSDVWVDAGTGAILKKQATARLGEAAAPTAARVFEYAPAADGLDVADLVDVDLVGVRGAVGDPLRGDHFETANCCKFVVCNDNSQDCLQNIPAGQTAKDVATCATQQDIDDGIAVESVIQPPDGIPSSALPIPPQFASFVPDPLYVKVVFCAEIPRARSVAAEGDRPAGWFFTPVDGDRANATRCGEAGADPIGCAAEEDEFAEVQVYHGTQVFFDHIRAVLDDEAFCLGGQSQLCEATGGPTLGEDGEPTRPFHIATNVLFPSFDTQALFTQIAPPNFGGQGRGGEPGNPVIIDDFQRLPNAAFVPALEGGPVQIPPELQAFAVLFNRPFDSNVYFQGSRDFAYDGDVTRHEFTHALVHSFVPGLASLGRDAFGGHAESGALNEGWADYFSSSFSNDPAVGDYAAQGLVAGELGLRNNDNDFRCPDNVIGQVHNDSEHWAGALWAIREEHRGGGGDVAVLDRALLEALALADNDEDMTRAAARAEAAIRSAIGDTLADFARAEFEARGVSGCLRVWPLAVVDADGTGITVTRKDVLVQPGKDELGVANFAPSVLQFRIDVPAGSAGFTLTWQQAAGGGGGFGGGGGEAPMAVAVTEVPVDDATAHIEWRYEGAGGNLAVPYIGDVAVDFNETTSAVTLGAADNNGVQAASFTQTLTSDPCAPRSFVASIVALEAGATLQNIDVDNIATDTACPSDDGDGDGDGDGAPDGCACSGTSASSASLGLFGLALLGLRRRRR
jgi:MYXO-CTERM domain-containing protein